MSSIINADTSDGLKFTSDTSGEIKLQSAGTDTVTVDTSGNVGIGTSSPSSQLAVQTTAGSSTGFLKFTDVTYGGDVRFGKNTGISNDAIAGTWAANNMLFYTNSSERMRIDSSGNVLIGTTSYSSSTDGNMINENGFFSTHNNSFNFTLNKASGASQTAYFVMYQNNVLVGYIALNGSGGVNYNSSSDYRLKENNVNINNGIEKVKLLKPYRFNFITHPDKTVSGFFAHEVQDIVPEAVDGNKDEIETYIDDDGNEQTRPKYQGLDQSKLVPLLTAALQEAITKIEDLETRIQALENA